MKNILIVIWLLIFSSIILISCAKAEEASLGISPSYIKNDHLIRGSYFEQEMIISRSNPIYNATAVIEFNDTKFHEWITFDPGLEVKMPVGEKRVPIIAKVKIPNEVALGRYKSSATIKLVGNDKLGQVTIVPAVKIEIDLNVTDEEYSELKINEARIENFSTDAPLILKLKVQNLGNVKASPSNLILRIMNLKREQIKVLKTENIEEVEPFQISEVIIKFDSHELAEGDYLAELSVYYKNEEIFNTVLSFSVYQGKDVLGNVDEQGSKLAQRQKIGNFLIKIGKTILFILLCILIALFFKRHLYKFIRR